MSAPAPNWRPPISSARPSHVPRTMQPAQFAHPTAMCIVPCAKWSRRLAAPASFPCRCPIAPPPLSATPIVIQRRPASCAAPTINSTVPNAICARRTVAATCSLCQWSDACLRSHSRDAPKCARRNLSRCAVTMAKPTQTTASSASKIADLGMRCNCTIMDRADGRKSPATTIYTKLHCQESPSSLILEQQSRPRPTFPQSIIHSMRQSALAAAATTAGSERILQTPRMHPTSSHISYYSHK